MNRHASFYQTNGNGSSTVFTIPHGCPITPYFASVESTTYDALGIIQDSGGVPCLQNSKTYIIDIITNPGYITITYPIAPPIGVNNLGWFWQAECS